MGFAFSLRTLALTYLRQLRKTELLTQLIKKLEHRVIDIYTFEINPEKLVTTQLNSLYNTIDKEVRRQKDRIAVESVSILTPEFWILTFIQHQHNIC